MSKSQITAGMEAPEHLHFCSHLQIKAKSNVLANWDFTYSPAADLSDQLHVHKEEFKKLVIPQLSNQYEEHNIIISGKAHHPNYTNTILLTRPHCSPVPVWSPLL